MYKSHFAYTPLKYYSAYLVLYPNKLYYMATLYSYKYRCLVCTKYNNASSAFFYKSSISASNFAYTHCNLYRLRLDMLPSLFNV